MEITHITNAILECDAGQIGEATYRQQHDYISTRILDDEHDAIHIMKIVPSEDGKSYTVRVMLAIRRGTYRIIPTETSKKVS